MNTESAAKPARRGYWVIPAMLVLFGLPYIVGLWWFYSGEMPELGTNNHGVLLNPSPHLAIDSVHDLKGQSIGQQQLNKKWVLLTFSTKVCNEACAKTLFHMRQIRRATGVEQGRVARLLIISPTVQQEYRQELERWPGLQLSSSEQVSLQRLKKSLESQLNSIENSIFIVDPRGDVILGYEATTNPKDIVKDLLKLLKVSAIG
ncbi:hypothetical protein MIB92_01305 [Aestuariirhabdus sp. Z084]|uniref:SCO family protein n=1 Tax=Aestuariirhabdus haliotis TaxID=2918751 RepID=UPI00201B38B1|nr:hypothetical protein [Aestuariirhabdus haliotis]MCL6414275.1 hypothetical protein [Aestuariirhabdus haliotis]MCL6418207.1 hypothetical protein [Aestuariirhabdus haliotis]